MKTIHTLLLLLLATSITLAQDAEATAAGTYNEGLAELKAKNYQVAFDKLMMAMELANPDDENDAKVLRLAKGNGAIAAYYSGNALLKEEKFDEAKARFEKGIELNPKAYTCYYGIAKSYDDQDMIAEAVPAYLKAAEVAESANKADRAERYISRAGSIIGTSYAAENYEQAIAGGEAFLAAKEDKDVSYYMAKALIASGKPSDALAHAEKAAELGGAEDEGKFLLGHAEALEAVGNKSAAAAAYLKVPAGKYHDHAQYKAGQME